MNIIWLFFKGKGLGILEEGCESRWDGVTRLFRDFLLLAENHMTTIVLD